MIKSGVPVDEKNNNGSTALHVAALNGHCEVAQTLLKHKAAINEKVNDGWTALHIAALSGHSDFVRTLLKRKAGVDEKSNDGDSYTALLMAALKDNRNVVQTLVKNGASLERLWRNATSARQAQESHRDCGVARGRASQTSRSSHRRRSKRRGR